MTFFPHSLSSLSTEILLSLAQAGDTDAVLRLALRYCEGETVPQDDAKAAKWFRRGALYGNIRSMFYFGKCCYEGKGVPKEEAEGRFWLQRAAVQGDREAQEYLTRKDSSSYCSGAN